MVQGAHGVAEWIIKHPEQKWNNGYLIFVSVPDIQTLNEWKNKLSDIDIDFSEFYEPDLNNELTSIACLNDGRLFKKLKIAS